VRKNAVQERAGLADATERQDEHRVASARSYGTRHRLLNAIYLRNMRGATLIRVLRRVKLSSGRR
jgi:hypothetical protein